MTCVPSQCRMQRRYGVDTGTDLASRDTGASAVAALIQPDRTPCCRGRGGS